MAFRRYIQQLTDNGFISSDLAESLVIGAFESLELAPKNQALARTSILDPVRAENDTVEVFDLKLSEARFLWTQATSNKLNRTQDKSILGSL